MATENPLVRDNSEISTVRRAPQRFGAWILGILLGAMAARGIGRRFPLITVATVGADRFDHRPRPDSIDGEVLDVEDVTEVDPPALPLRPE